MAQKTILHTKSLLTVTAILEGSLGLALLAVPSFVISLLLSISPGGIAVTVVARVAGAAIFSLAIACWFSRNNSNDPAVLRAILFYNVAVGFVLFYCIYPEGLSSVFLWAAALLHMFLAVWCMTCLQKKAPLKTPWK
jgi:hypothetical protein